MIKRILMILSLFPVTVFAGPMNSSYEGAPGVHAEINDNTQASTIDDHARNARIIIADRLEVEHHVGDTDGTNDDNGLHRLGSARVYMQDGAPTSLADSHPTPATVTDLLNTGTSGGGVADFNDSASLSAAGIQDDVGHGRLWVDTNDDDTLYVYTGEAGDNTPVTIADGWGEIDHTDSNARRSRHNLILHGGFEGAVGSGDASLSTEPYGWTIVLTPTIGYIDPTSTSEGEGYMLAITATGAGDEGIKQSIAGLKASTSYTVTVRAKLFGGAGNCELEVTGGASTANATTTSSTFVTLTAVATTNSTPSDLVVFIQNDADTGVCHYDHVSIVETVFTTPHPGVIAFRKSTSSSPSCTSSYSSGCNDLATVTVTPPTSGYHVQIYARVAIKITTPGTCAAQLWNNSDSIQLDEADVQSESLDGNAIIPVTLLYVSTILLTAGESTAYTINVKEDGTGAACTVVSTNLIIATLLPSGG